MSLVSIKINDDGQHWDKQIRICGVLVYHRHDYTRGKENPKVGFAKSQDPQTGI